MRFTVKMRENNVVMLRNLYEFVAEEESIKLVVFEGDLQHKTPSDLREVAKWRFWFKKLGRLMQQRMKTAPKIQFVGIDNHTKEGLKSGDIYPLVSCRGNHDDEIKMKQKEQYSHNDGGTLKSEIQYTFFDELLSEGLIINPKGVAFKENGQHFYIDIRNYGEANRKLPKTVREGDWKVMAVFHDNVLMPESPLWMLKSKGQESVYDAEKVMEGVDVGILGHIHEKVDPIYITREDGSQGVLWQTGSMGRTSFKEENMRDVGYCGLLTTEDLTQFGEVEIDVIPAQEYFSFEKALANKKRNQEYKDFELRMDVVERQSRDPRDDIRDLEDVEDDVKECCIQILTEVMERSR